MKAFIAIAILAAGLLSFAEENEEVYISPITGRPVVLNGKYTLEEIKARDEKMMKKTGGFVMQKAEGPLALFVDARNEAKLTVDEVARLYKMGTHLDCNFEKIQRGEKRPLEFAQGIMAEKKPLLLVMVVEKADDLPALSVFPEERIGIVNADKLKGAAENDPSAPEMRVAKEIWRAMGFIGGVGFSAQENDMMQPYYTLAELDKNNHPYIQPMNMLKMQAMWKRFGVKKERRMPYRVACQEGWANPPTNDLQRAVWDEVHKAPEKPIKIEFDEKRDKGK